MYEKTYSVSGSTKPMSLVLVNQWYTKYQMDGDKIYGTKYENLIDNKSNNWIILEQSGGTPLGFFWSRGANTNGKNISFDTREASRYIRLTLKIKVDLDKLTRTGTKTIASFDTEGLTYTYNVWNINS